MKFKEILSYVIIILVVVLIRTFIVTPIKVNGDSMYPTLEDGDLMILTKYERNDIDRFDIVVIDIGDEKIIKRVIGLPKEDVAYKNGKLSINGKIIKNEFGFGETSDFEDYCTSEEYFVLGDNREVSKDSRAVGCISKDKILGTTKFVFFPFTKVGSVE